MEAFSLASLAYLDRVKEEGALNHIEGKKIEENMEDCGKPISDTSTSLYIAYEKEKSLNLEKDHSIRETFFHKVCSADWPGLPTFCY